MARRLWAHTEGGGRPKDAPLFESARGGRLFESNLRYRVLTRVRERVELPWGTFHTFRHTCASLQLAAGKNVKQVSEWLGHADSQITHQTYLHLMDDGLGDAAFLDEAVRVERRSRSSELPRAAGA